jgi:cytochrome c biogenesis protein CcdA
MGGNKGVSVKLITFINGLPFVCMVAVITAMFFSEKIYEHRIQAISSIIGFAMILWGIDIIAKQDFAYFIKMFKKKTVIKKIGKSAKRTGALILIIGILLLIWGAFFWVGFIRNI